MPRKLDALKELVDSGNTAAVFTFMLEFIADEIDRLDGNTDELSCDVKALVRKLDTFVLEDWANFQNKYSEQQGEMRGRSAMLATAISLGVALLANLGKIVQFFGG